MDFRTGTLSLKAGAGRATFAASIGSVSLSGSASFPRLDPLSIAFSVSSPELDLAGLGALLGGGAQGGATTVSRYPIAHGTIAIGKVMAAPIEVTNLKGQLAFYGSKVQLTACTFSAYGGSVSGNAVIHGAAGTPVDATAHVAGLNVAQTLTALGWGSGKVSGALAASFTFATKLTNDPKASLTATGTFAVSNGSFPGMNFNSNLAQLANLAGINVPSGSTQFSYFGGDLRIAKERSYSNLLRLVATGMTGTARGSFGFDQSISYNGTGTINILANETSSTGSPVLAMVAQVLHTTVQQNVGTGQVQIPFSLRGTIDSPQFSTAGIAQLITNNIPAQVIQQQTGGSPVVQSLLKLIPGF
jgi:AsmA-like C-terminal region